MSGEPLVGSYSLGVADFGINARATLVALINNAENGSFKIDDFYFLSPAPNNSTHPVYSRKNTKLVLVPKPSTGMVGKKTVYYNRLDLSILLSDEYYFKQTDDILSHVGKAAMVEMLNNHRGDSPNLIEFNQLNELGGTTLITLEGNDVGLGLGLDDIDSGATFRETVWAGTAEKIVDVAANINSLIFIGRKTFKMKFRQP